MLSEAQARAVEHVRAVAIGARPGARARVEHALRDEGVGGDVDAVLAADLGTVAVNFHPDRIAADGRTVAEALLDDGVYRSQFETRISNGGLSAFPGGDRDRWEERLFGGAYHGPRASGVDRPKYGGLHTMAYPDGPCPRFGSCVLVLSRQVLERTTICFGDSHVGPRDVGVPSVPDAVTAAIVEAVVATGRAFGQPATLASLVEVLGLPVGERWPSRRHGRALDDYVEAQVHGPVALASDAVALVADPSFRGTSTGDLLEEIAARHAVDLSWHAGFTIALDDVPEHFRGPAIPRIARLVADRFCDRPRLDAEAVGRAARSVVRDPDAWAVWASPAETLQHLKQLWHVLVAYGSPHL